MYKKRENRNRDNLWLNVIDLGHRGCANPFPCLIDSQAFFKRTLVCIDHKNQHFEFRNPKILVLIGV